MEINPKNLIHHELIGLNMRVYSSTNPNMIGLEGKVVDETRNMIIMEDAHSIEKKVPKSHSEFVFTLPDEKCVKVRGDLLAIRPEDRIRKRFR